MLTPALVRELFHDEEIPLRQRQWTSGSIDKISRYGAPVGSHIHCHDVLDRGMDEARRLIDMHESSLASFPTGTVILAERLTGGKGRFQRQWHAPPGGVWLTVVIVNTLLPQSSRLYPLAAGVACCELLRQYGINCSIKWINDILAPGGKISGTLIETVHGGRSREEYILIGMGVNVNNTDFPEELDGHACSMLQCLGGPTDRRLFAGRLLAKLAWYEGLLHYVEEIRLDQAGLNHDEADGIPGQKHPLMECWRQLSDTVGRLVRFGFDVREHPQYHARAVDITEDGGLVMEPVDHEARIVELSGEIEYL